MADGEFLGPLEALAKLLGADPSLGEAATPDAIMARIQAALPEALRERTDVEQMGVGRRPYVKPTVKGAGQAGPRMPWESPKMQLDNQQTADVLGDLFMGDGKNVSRGAGPSIAKKHDAVYAADADPSMRLSNAQASANLRGGRGALAPRDAPLQQPWRDLTTESPWKGGNRAASRLAEADFWSPARDGGVGRDSTNVAGYLSEPPFAQRERFMTTQQQALADAPRGIAPPDRSAWRAIVEYLRKGKGGL
jgi:hypothetical protein